MENLCDRSRVSGFLRTEGRRIVNGDGREILLVGPGLGNWFLPEGYMWHFGTPNFPGRADRPRRIEQAVRELTGDEYAGSFWKRFRDEYITEADVAKMAQCGFNSLRLPINYRVLMQDGESMELLEDGFEIIDRLLGWCEEHKIYAFLDMHGAPGGQTGANIDDCVDNRPRLLMDEYQYEKGLALWEAIARRYKDRWIVAGYDLLNEPVAPEHSQYRDKLMDFYTDAAKRIRALGDRHILSIEGMHWATNLEIFERHYDDNMLIHFHRYWCATDDETLFGALLALSEKLNAPLWLGESGENQLDWYRSVFPRAVQLGISWNFWPWKRMKTDNPCPCEIASPEGWDEVLAYLDGGKHPGYQRAREIFDGYLRNMRLENVGFRQDAVDALLGK